MNIGIYSDLHFNNIVDELEFIDYVTFRDDVFYINAGDVYTRGKYNWNEKNNWFTKYPDHFHVMGNHDFYYDQPITNNQLIIKDGLLIAGTTLWTELTPATWPFYSWLTDQRAFDRKLTYEQYNNMHLEQKDFLFASNADIIVSHHGPSFQSLHPKYQNDPLNNCFLSNFDELIHNMPKPPKLWIHGHVHNAFDYMIGSTRVVCWPRGYRGEHNFNHYELYSPKIIEVKKE